MALILVVSVLLWSPGSKEKQHDGRAWMEERCLCPDSQEEGGGPREIRERKARTGDNTLLGKPLPTIDYTSQYNSAVG